MLWRFPLIIFWVKCITDIMMMTVGMLLGEKTFGKGSVQTLIPLPDGDGMKLIIAKYYTPSGICIHGIGIEPDVKVVEKEEIYF